MKDYTKIISVICVCVLFSFQFPMMEMERNTKLIVLAVVLAERKNKDKINRQKVSLGSPPPAKKLSIACAWCFLQNYTLSIAVSQNI